MWRNIAILAVVIGAISLAACKRDWKCTCTFGPLSVDTVLTDMTKKEAQAKCDEYNKQAQAVGGSCSLSKAK